MATKSNSTGKRPPAVMIHGLKHARIACSLAVETGMPLELHSAPDAAASLGPHWFQKILDAIEEEFPDLQVVGILDCGASPGYALAALRQGLKRIRYSGPKKTREKIQDIAQQQKAVADTGWPEILDLGREADPEEACRRWFGR